MFNGAHHFIINGGNFTAISSDEATKVYQWLNAPDCSSNYVTAEDKKLQGTGKWIFDLDEYKKWKSEPSVLWIQGPAGSGKTILTTTILQDVQQVHKNAVWYHYFDTRDNTGLKTTYHGFLLSVIKQMGLENEQINPALYTLYKTNKFNGITTKELQKLLKTMIEERNAGYIVVDALDECKEADKVLKWLSSHSSQLWMLVTSRLPAVGFQNRIINIALGEKGSRMNADIETYLQSKIDTDPRFKGETGDYIKGTLKKGADGVFRWVECQLRAVQQYTSPTGVRKALSKLPKDLKETYANTLQKCQNAENAEEAQQLLLWLLYAFEPLTKAQFSEIFALDLEKQMIYPSMEFGAELPVDSTFVTVGQNDIVQLAHASVKEYLMDYSSQKQTKDLFGLNEQLAHDIMTQTTIIYLIQKEDINYDHHSSFASYSVYNWLSHASKVEEHKLKGKAQDLIHRMLENDGQYFARWERKYTSDTYFKPGTPLYYGALNGLCEVVQKLISKPDPETANVYINMTGGEYGNALQAASFSGHKAIVNLLLEKGADVNAQGGKYGNALQAASHAGDEGIVKLLLEQGADVNVQGGEYGNALQAAACMQNEGIVKLLLEQGADVNAQGGQFGNALQVASHAGDEGIVKLLLEKGAEYGNALQAAAFRQNEGIVKSLLEQGADVNAQGGQFGNTLQAASYAGDEGIVKLLLEKGADVNAQGGKYGNALQAAAFRQNEGIVKLLLEQGADVNAQGGQLGNTLQAAAFRQNEGIVKLLLEQGADVNAQGGQFGNALQAASHTGDEGIVKLLLEKGADVNARGGKYNNALQIATYWKHEGIVKLLLEKGADANVQGGKCGDKHRDALRAAVYMQSEEIAILMLLLDNVGVNTQGEYLRTYEAE